MIFRFLVILLLSKSLSAFYYKDISKNFNKSDELRILKSLDIEPDFIDDYEYNRLKDKISQLDIHQFVTTIRTSPRIFNTLKDIIQKSNVPDNFLYMAMIESKFLSSAKSNKNAAGLWQLMPSTAKLLKLKHTKLIDERLDPIKSTKAAINYISYLHDRFKKWYLAALAYNCGETRLAKAIKKSGSDNIFVLLSNVDEYLPKETRTYIRRLIIASLIAKNKHIVDEMDKYPKSKYLLKKIKIEKKEFLDQLAKNYHIKYDKIKKYNSHILKNFIPPGYSIYLPKNIVEKYNKIATYTYTIKKDTTLLTLSKRFNIPIKKIKKLNKNISFLLSKNDKIKLPRYLRFKKDRLKFEKFSKDKVKKDKRVDTNNTMEYIVKEGDTLYILSLKFNNRVSTIKKLNPHIGYDLKSGTKLILKR